MYVPRINDPRGTRLEEVLKVAEEATTAATEVMLVRDFNLYYPRWGGERVRSAN